MDTTLSVNPTLSWTGIAAFAIEACLGRGTIVIGYAFRSATQIRITEIFFEACARRSTVSFSTN